jgi:2-C-methyl-D-erythritol 2,4-cyclodiphosphate synthase
MSSLFDLRVGHGFDLHRLEAGEGVTLGGVFIPCAYRVVAHSDGDAAIHALCDALLGAIGRGDIGEWFPDTDPAFAGADSRELLKAIMRAVTEAGYAVVNADLTIIAQAPKIAPHKSAMVAALAPLLGVSADRINLKATTHEGVDAIGRKEALSVHAVVLLAPVP